MSLRPDDPPKISPELYRCPECHSRVEIYRLAGVTAPRCIHESYVEMVKEG